MAHIIPMLLDRIADRMGIYLVDDVPYDDPSRIDEIKVGRFQQNPSEAYLRCAVIHGDLDASDINDAIAPQVVRNHPIAFQVEAREIGGGQMWYRRGIVYPELFFINKGYDEEYARDLAYKVLARIQDHIEEIAVYDLADEYGEQAVKLFSTASNMIQSGGPPQSWIFRGKVFWECLTEREH